MSEVHEEWLPIIGRSLAYLCMRYQAAEGGENKARDAIFLDGIGIARGDIAKMLNTTTASVNEMISKARRGKGRKRGAPKKKKRAAR